MQCLISYRLAVIGLGYVGKPIGINFASGHGVSWFQIAEVAKVRMSISSVFEPTYKLWLSE